MQRDRFKRNIIRHKGLVKPPGMDSLWYELPGELRNCIYKWCLLLEEDKVQSVCHFPHGFRRCRSKHNNAAYGNFPSSYWGFTQVSRRIRAEFMPWLLRQRRVKTPLATLNEYVEVFHPTQPGTRNRMGWVEPDRPKDCRIPVPIWGIEILNLLRHNHLVPDFHLELRAEYPMISTYKRDEVDILYRLSSKIAWSGELYKSCGITSIVLIPHEVKFWSPYVAAPHFVTRPSIKHRPMVRLVCQPTHTADGRLRTAQEQRWCVVNWLFNESQLAYYQDLWLHVNLNGYEVMWEVNMPGFIVGRWERFADGYIVLREHWLLRVTTISAGGHPVSTVKELLPP